MQHNEATDDHNNTDSADARHGGMSALEFVREVLGEDPYSKQQEILNAVDGDARRVSVVGCHGSGKDWTAARILLWWVHSHSPAKAVVTGPTLRQVNDIVWNEVRHAYGKAMDELPGKMRGTARYEIDAQTYALGFTSNSPYKILGHHSPNLLAIITEAHAVPNDYINAIKRLNPSLLLMTGNPFLTYGIFYDSHHRQRHLWQTIQIGADDTPNVKEGRIVYPGMMTRQDVEDRKADWGEDTPMYIGGVLGEFPDNLDTAIVPLRAATAAANRELEPEGEIVVACDVARKGHAQTVVMRRQGAVATIAYRARGNDTMQVANRLKSYCDQEGVDVLVIDDAGIGGGVTDRVREMGLKTARIEEFNGSHTARRYDRFANRNAEAWWAMRERYMEGDISTPNDDNLIGQISSREYDLDSKGRIELQSKREMPDTLDEADALAMTFAIERRKKEGVIKIWV